MSYFYNSRHNDRQLSKIMPTVLSKACRWGRMSFTEQDKQDGALRLTCDTVRPQYFTEHAFKLCMDDMNNRVRVNGRQLQHIKQRLKTANRIHNMHYSAWIRQSRQAKHLQHQMRQIRQVRTRTGYCTRQSPKLTARHEAMWYQLEKINILCQHLSAAITVITDLIVPQLVIRKNQLSDERYRLIRRRKVVREHHSHNYKTIHQEGYFNSCPRNSTSSGSCCSCKTSDPRFTQKTAQFLPPGVASLIAEYHQPPNYPDGTSIRPCLVTWRRSYYMCDACIACYGYLSRRQLFQLLKVLKLEETDKQLPQRARPNAWIDSDGEW